MNIITQPTEENSSHAVVKHRCGNLKKIVELYETSSEQLMPYGAVVKAIYVKANGLPAYNKAFRCENLYCAEQYEQAST